MGRFKELNLLRNRVMHPVKMGYTPTQADLDLLSAVEAEFVRPYYSEKYAFLSLPDKIQIHLK
jgi:hypothetical protein